jgi:hypothetical protein
MTLPCITKARRFDAHAHRPFWIDGEQVGWVRATDVPLLVRWPDVFEIDATRVTLASRFNTPRTAAFPAGATKPMRSAMPSTRRRWRISNVLPRASSAR